MPSNPYGKLPIVGVWALWGSCFYFFLAYQMIGDRGRRNRQYIGEVLGLIPPKQEEPSENDSNSALDATTYRYAPGEGTKDE